MKTPRIEYLLHLLISLFSFYACEFELEHANPLDNLVITTGSIQEASTFSCKIQGTITTNEFNGVDNYGHCWSLQNYPTVDDASTSFGTFKGEKTFVSDINNLEVNTSYYVRTYAVANDTVIYANGIIFIPAGFFLPCNITGTSSPPSVLSLTPSSNTYNFSDNITVTVNFTQQASVFLYENEVQVANLCSFCLFNNGYRNVTLPSSSQISPSSCYTIRVRLTGGNILHSIS